MILMSIDLIQEGMVCAKPILAHNGTALLDEDVVIKKRYLDRLNKLGITNIYIRDDLGDKSFIHSIVSTELKRKSFFAIENVMNNVCSFDEQDAEKIKNIVSNILEELIVFEDVLINLSDIRAVDDYTFGHSINVSILSMIIAINLGYDKNELKDLGVGAMLHDIGKTKVDMDILNKPGNLLKGEYEEIKKHTLFGYEILNDIANISSSSKMIILSHHERYDGNGYPYNLKAENIHEYARIVSVADVYDALTNDRVYKSRIGSDKAIEYILSMSGSQFDSNIVLAFLKSVAKYPIGKGVILSTGLKGYVVSNKKEYISRPVVRILYDNNGDKVRIPYIVDLSKVEDSLSIVSTIEDLELF